MKKYQSIIILCSCLAWFTISCSKDPTPSDDGSGDVFIGDFSNSWNVIKGNATGPFTILIATVDSAKGTGTLTGRDIDLSELFKGSFDQAILKIQFLTNAEAGQDNGPQAGLSFKGVYDTLSNPTKLRFVNELNANDSLVLERS